MAKEQYIEDEIKEPTSLKDFRYKTMRGSKMVDLIEHINLKRLTYRIFYLERNSRGFTEDQAKTFAIMHNEYVELLEDLRKSLNIGYDRDLIVGLDKIEIKESNRNG